MRRALIVGAIAAFIALLDATANDPAASAPSTIASTSATARLHPGDAVTYDLIIDSNVRFAPAVSGSQPVTMTSDSQGTEKITTLRVDADGTAHMRVDLAIDSSGALGQRSMRQTMLVRIGSDGSVAAENPTGDGAAQFLKSFSDAAKLMRGRTLYVGERFAQSATLPGPVPVIVNMHEQVVSEKTYLGYPAFAIQSTGNGTFDTSIAGIAEKGTFDVAGTSYVDQRDQLFIGAAARSNVDASVSGAQAGHLTALWTTTITLASFVHGKVRPASLPTHAPVTPTPAPPSPSPTPVPTPTSGYYTPTPPAPTPSPVYTSYPQHR